MQSCNCFNLLQLCVTQFWKRKLNICNSNSYLINKHSFWFAEILNNSLIPFYCRILLHYAFQPPVTRKLRLPDPFRGYCRGGYTFQISISDHCKLSLSCAPSKKGTKTMQRLPLCDKSSNPVKGSSSFRDQRPSYVSGMGKAARRFLYVTILLHSYINTKIWLWTCLLLFIFLYTLKYIYEAPCWAPLQVSTFRPNGLKCSNFVPERKRLLQL